MSISGYSLKTKSNCPNTSDDDDDDYHRRITPIDFKSVSKLPESHTWVVTPPDNNLFTTSESIPIIDLSDPNAISLIQHACEKWGIFQLTNHGVPSQLLHEAELQSHKLFSLPFDQKLRAIRSHNSMTGYGTSRMSSLHPKRVWSEGFTILGPPEQHVSKLWPHDHDQRDYFCNVMETCQNEMNSLSETMVDLMFGSLGLTQEDTKYVKPKKGWKNPHGPLQLNSYPVCPDPTKAIGLAAHTDTSLLTLLYQSNSTIGLQVYKEGMGWVSVHPLKYALIVNIGDLMQILSNGRFKSVLHRAVVNKTHHRISMANFYGPPKDVTISPFIQLTDLHHPPLYRSVTWNEYLDIKATHFNMALEFIKNDVV